MKVRLNHRWSTRSTPRRAALALRQFSSQLAATPPEAMAAYQAIAAGAAWRPDGLIDGSAPDESGGNAVTSETISTEKSTVTERVSPTADVAVIYYLDT